MSERRKRKGHRHKGKFLCQRTPVSKESKRSLCKGGVPWRLSPHSSYDCFLFRFFFSCGPFKKSLLSLLQYCFYFIFWFFGSKACGILALWPGIEPAYPAMEGEILTMGSPGKSLWLKISSTQANVPHFPPPLFHPLTLLWVRKLLRGYFKNRPLSVASWHASNFSHITAELKWKLATGNTLSLTLSAATLL